MSYYEVEKCIKENQDIIGDPTSDPLMWNLSVALLNLSEAIEYDLGQIKTVLGTIASSQQRR